MRFSSTAASNSLLFVLKPRFGGAFVFSRRGDEAVNFPQIGEVSLMLEECRVSLIFSETLRPSWC